MNKQQRRELQELSDKVEEIKSNMDILLESLVDSEEMTQVDLEQVLTGIDLNALSDTLDELAGDLEIAESDEQDKLYNMPESLQSSERGESMQEGIDALCSAKDALAQAAKSLDDHEAKTPSDYYDLIHEVVSELEEATDNLATIL